MNSSNFGNLKKTTIFEGWSDRSLNRVKEYCVVKEFKKNNLIFEKGDKSNDLFIIIEGGVDLQLNYGKEKKYVTFANLYENDYFGDLSFIDNSPRSCRVIANQDSKFLIINQKIKHKDKYCFNMMKESINKRMPSTINESNKILLRNNIRLKSLIDEKEKSGKLFLSTLIFLCLVIISNKIFTNNQNIDFHSIYFVLLYFVVLSSPLIYFIKSSKIEYKEFGIEFRNSIKKTLNALTFTSWLIPAMYIFASYHRDIPVLEFHKLVDTNFLGIGSLIYFPIALSQQLIRSVIQESLIVFFHDNHELNSIIISAILFGIFHIHLGITAVIATFLAGILFGYIFYKQKNIFSVSAVHFVLGITAFSLKLFNMS